VRKAQEGDKQAFGELYEIYFPQIYYFALRQLSSEDQAQEVAQETFLRVLLKLDSLKNPQAFQSWLYRIAHTVLQDTTRRAATDRAHQCELDALDDYGYESELLQASQQELEYDPEEESGTLFTDQVLDSDFGREFVQAVLNKLTAVQKETVLLYYFAGLKPREIAPILDLSSAVVSKRLHDAHRALQQMASAAQQQVQQAQGAAAPHEGERSAMPMAVALPRLFAEDLRQSDVTAARAQTTACLAALLPVALSGPAGAGAAAAARAGFFIGKGHHSASLIKAITAATRLISASAVKATCVVITVGVVAGGTGYVAYSRARDNARSNQSAHSAAQSASSTKTTKTGGSVLAAQAPTPVSTSDQQPTQVSNPPQPAPAPAPVPAPVPADPTLTIACPTLRYEVGTRLTAARILRDAGVSAQAADGAEAQIVFSRLSSLDTESEGTTVLFIHATDTAGRASNTETIEITLTEATL